MSGRSTKTKKPNEYQGLYEQAADALAERVIEKHWAYYAGAGAAISLSAGLMIGFLYYLSDQPRHLFMMPLWFMVIGAILYTHYYAFSNQKAWRGYTQVALVAAMILWPISMAVAFVLVG